MAQMQDNFKRGTAEFLVLSLLNEGEAMHGYRITQEMQQRSEGRYTILEGTLYLILTRMEEEGLLNSHVVLVGKKRTRRYYSITPKGKAHLQTLLQSYDEVTLGIDLILGRKGANRHEQSSQSIPESH